MKDDTFYQQIERLESNFDARRNEKRLVVWWEEVKNCADRRFERAVTNLIRNEQRFPSLAVILSYINAIDGEEYSGDGCKYCGGRGWISVAMVHPYNPEKGYYSPSVPCKCRISNMPTEQIINKKWGTATVDGKEYPIFFPPEKTGSKHENKLDTVKRV